MQTNKPLLSSVSDSQTVVLSPDLHSISGFVFLISASSRPCLPTAITSVSSRLLFLHFLSTIEFNVFDVEFEIFDFDCKNSRLRLKYYCSYFRPQRNAILINNSINLVGVDLMVYVLIVN